MVIIRYQSFAANAVLTHRFQSVASPPKRDGKLLPRVMRFPSRRAPFGSIFFRIGAGLIPSAKRRWQRVVRYSRCTNLFGPLQAARRFVSSLRQLLKIKFGLLRLGWTLRRRTRKGR